ncbi:cation:dicarboxylase symporter family transporter [Aerococcaceae bacterium DSM 109652]|uniref:Cation:dicarboxylase symporter family transporter n=2 Tax=Fundicoccus ignavus TaxID=2664442 RepID=A0A844C6K5_9LACT|nr:cation:dicarboxylase symporter family transporter [Fundicoccus ignavus]
MTQVLIGAVLGIIVGRFVPQLGLEAEFLGSLFMNMIQMVIVPLIFPLIVLAIVEMSQAQRFGGLAIKSFIYFFGVTTALIVLTLAIDAVSGVGSVFYNCMSALSHTSGHRYAPELTDDLLHRLESS